MTAQFTGVGVGPGDPELITLKAVRLIQQADVISYLCNQDGRSQAKHIARLALAEASSQEEIPIVMPMQEDRTIANQRYNQGASDIQTAINAGKSVVFLCEGDPLFFGSFAYLLERLQDSCRCEVIPGISSVHAAASVLQAPLTMQKESFAVISGRHNDDTLDKTLRLHDSVVIMKAGLSRQRILQALKRTQRTTDASYLEYIGRDQQVIVADVNQLDDNTGPYFSLFVITRKNREPS